MYQNRAREISIAVFLVLLSLVVASLTHGFFEWQNLSDIVVKIAYVSIAAVGVMAVILTGQIDISIGSVFGACAIVGGMLAKQGWSLAEIAAVMMLLGACAGAVNGAFVAYLNVPSIIVTLATMALIRGVIIILTGGEWIYDVPASFQTLATGHSLGLPNPVWVMAAVLLGASALLRGSAWGRSLYAVGSNAAAARLSGIAVPRTVFSAFCVEGALVGLSALVFVSRFATIQPNVGDGFEFFVITAVVVGGVSIFGGSGSLAGVVMGCALLGFTSTALTFLRVSSYWEQALQGLFILLAVSLNLSRPGSARIWGRRRHAAA